MLLSSSVGICPAKILSDLIRRDKKKRQRNKEESVKGIERRLVRSRETRGMVEKDSSSIHTCW